MQSVTLLQKVSLSVVEASSVGAYVQMIVILGLQLIVTSSIRLLILLTCRIFHTILWVIKRPNPP